MNQSYVRKYNEFTKTDLRLEYHREYYERRYTKSAESESNISIVMNSITKEWDKGKVVDQLLPAEVLYKTLNDSRAQCPVGVWHNVTQATAL